jgi:D-lactate dehydrogenase
MAKRGFMAQALGSETLAAMRAIKGVFDPDGILNPGKVLPE